MACSICKREGHNRARCPFNNYKFFSDVYKGICQCCGALNKPTVQYNSDDESVYRFLELCKDCHLHCAYQGSYSNQPIRMRVCRLTQLPSLWTVSEE